VSELVNENEYAWLCNVRGKVRNTRNTYWGNSMTREVRTQGFQDSHLLAIFQQANTSRSSSSSTLPRLRGFLLVLHTLLPCHLPMPPCGRAIPAPTVQLNMVGRGVARLFTCPCRLLPPSAFLGVRTILYDRDCHGKRNDVGVYLYISKTGKFRH